MTQNLPQVMPFFLAFFFAAALGSIFFKIITHDGKPARPVHHGRKWCAWMVLIASIAVLPEGLAYMYAEFIAQYVLAAVVFGGMAFVAGAIYGSIKLRNQEKETESISMETLQNLIESGAISKEDLKNAQVIYTDPDTGKETEL